jgi:hypothetical protein
MARIRTIKPEFPQSETLGTISRDARLTFILLWTIADDHGRCKAASKVIAGQIFPFDEDAPTSIDTWLDELEHVKCIHRYVVNGSRYIQISNWKHHQKVDKPGKSHFPEPPGGTVIDTVNGLSREPLETVAKLSTTDLGPRTLDLVPSTKDLVSRISDSLAARAEKASQGKTRWEVLTEGLMALAPPEAKDWPLFRVKIYGTEIILPALKDLMAAIEGEGFDLDTHVFPAVKQALPGIVKRVRDDKKNPPGSWSYFVPIIRDYKATEVGATYAATVGEKSASTLPAKSVAKPMGHWTKGDPRKASLPEQCEFLEWYQAHDSKSWESGWGAAPWEGTCGMDPKALAIFGFHHSQHVTICASTEEYAFRTWVQILVDWLRRDRSAWRSYLGPEPGQLDCWIPEGALKYAEDMIADQDRVKPHEGIDLEASMSTPNVKRVVRGTRSAQDTPPP